MRRKLLQYLLWVLAKLVLWRYHPLIIGVAGSTGKSSTKEAIYYALKNNFSVVRSLGNLNTEIGLPLTIIRGDDAKRNIFLWIKNIFKALRLLIFKDKHYPRVLILEMSEDQPGLISYLCKLSRPKIGVISWIGEIPVHNIFYSQKSDIQEEIKQLVYSLPEDGWAILNADNPLSLQVKPKIKAKILTYGTNQQADVRISDYSLQVEKDLSKTGMLIRLEYKGSYVPLKVKKVFGLPQAYALAAGAAVGLSLGLNFVSVVQSLESYKKLKARTTIIKGIKNTWILDDSYNSNPDALRSAIEIFRQLVELIKKDKVYPLRRRIIILGEMRELGKYSREAHKNIAPLIKENTDLLILVGPELKITAEECKRLGFPEKNIFWYESSDEAAEKARTIIQTGDFFLVKGSRGVHMERVTQNLMASPEKAADYLCFEEPT